MRASIRRDAHAHGSLSTTLHLSHGRRTHQTSTQLSTSGTISRRACISSIHSTTIIWELQKSGMGSVERWKSADVWYRARWSAASSWACHAGSTSVSERVAGKQNTDHVRFNSSKKVSKSIIYWWSSGVLKVWVSILGEVARVLLKLTFELVLYDLAVC
jgi:hypothetical protein